MRPPHLFFSDHVDEEAAAVGQREPDLAHLDHSIATGSTTGAVPGASQK